VWISIGNTQVGSPRAARLGVGVLIGATGEPDIPGIPAGNADDGLNYLVFLSELRTALPSTASLSIAAPASYWYLKQFEIGPTALFVDYIVFMTCKALPSPHPEALEQAMLTRQTTCTASGTMATRTPTPDARRATVCEVTVRGPAAERAIPPFNMSLPSQFHRDVVDAFDDHQSGRALQPDRGGRGELRPFVPDGGPHLHR
jgi:hypothetical protein